MVKFLILGLIATCGQFAWAQQQPLSVSLHVVNGDQSVDEVLAQKCPWIQGHLERKTALQPKEIGRVGGDVGRVVSKADNKANTTQTEAMLPEGVKVIVVMPKYTNSSNRSQRVIQKDVGVTAHGGQYGWAYRNDVVLDQSKDQMTVLCFGNGQPDPTYYASRMTHENTDGSQPSVQVDVYTAQ